MYSRIMSRVVAATVVGGLPYVFSCTSPHASSPWLPPIAHADSGNEKRRQSGGTGPTTLRALRQTVPHVPDMSDSNEVILLPGSSSTALAKRVAGELSIRLGRVEVSRFSDGEVDCDIKDSVRGKHVFILQSCSAPVNDNIMEILLMISCAKRAGADRITAVIPYFGYKYHKRGHAISTKHSSRFLWSVSADFAKMLEVMGVDRVISVDLQRPGEGQETCFFSNKIPVESVSSVELMADYVAANIPLGKNVVIVASNSDCIKKARKFQQGLKSKVDTIESIGLAAFLHSYGAEKHHNSTASLLGHSDVRGADVIILDEVVETASTMSILCRRLINQGAKRVYLVATHGLFTENSMERIHASPVDKVIVTDSVQLPEFVSSKVVQVSMARSLAKVIDTEFHSSEANRLEDEDDYVID